MIKVSVWYPNEADASFDHDYYRDSHMPMVKSKMGDKLVRYEIDKGLAGGAPDTPPTYIAAAHLFCESVDDFQAGFAPHAAEILADIPNYTNTSPVIQVSEVVD